METQEDRLRRMKREREGIASASWEPNPTAPREPSAASATWELNPVPQKPSSTATATWELNPAPPKPSSTAAATWELNPTAPRNTGIAQGSWDEKPKPSNSVSVSWGTPESSTASVTWSPNTPEGLAAEITKPKPAAVARSVPPAVAKPQEFARDETLDANIQQDFQDSMRPAPPAPPSRPETRADKASAAAAAMSEEQFTDAFKRQLTARDAKLIDKANDSNAMIERIRAARQTGIGDAPHLSALAQQMMYRPDGSVRPVPSWAMLDKWAEIDALAGRRRESGKHIAVPPTQPTEGQLASISGTKPAAIAPPAAQRPKMVPVQDAAVAAADAGPLPAVPARPVGLQAPEVPKPADAAVERPEMVPMDANAAVQPEPVPMPSKITPAQRKMEARAKERSMQKNASMKPHLDQAARDMGIEGVPFEELTGEQITDLRYKAGKLQRDAARGQLNDRQSDRNQSREQNVPMALATAQRLQGRGRALLAQAGGLDDSDPSKAALQAQGEQMLAQGNSQHATFMNAWERQSEQQIQQNVVRTAMIFGKAGAGIVEGHLRGQQEMARARLNDQGQRDDRIAAEAGMDRRANNRADVDLALADKNITAQEIQQQRDREQRIAELRERERLHGLDQAQRERLAKDERDAAAHRQKLDLADRQKGREAQAAQNPVPMQPAQQRAQLWEPLKAADSNPDDATPVQQYVDDFMQTLASQEGLQPQQRQIQGNQVKAWANQHVMSRWESDKLRDSDRGYIRSLAYATDADGNNTGKLKDRSTFVREMGSHYKGSNWASMAAKLGAFYDRLQKEEKESANLTQVGIPDYPVV